jgi:hypothetical protein
MEYRPTENEKEIIRIVTDEVSQWKNGDVWVTDNVKYQMKEIVQKSRKNYLGKFDEPLDEITGKKKIFVPLTEDMVETFVKNIDLDSADINIKTTNPNGYSAAVILRYLLNYFMRRNYFGELLNDMIRLFCTDGTIVIKTLKNYSKKIKSQVVKNKIVDTTNFFIDPQEDNIQDAGSVIERNVLKVSEAKEYPWDNLDYLKGFNNISKINSIYGINSATNSEVPYSEVYERWGDLPGRLIPGYKGNKNDWVPSIVIVSNIYRGPVVHKVIINEKGIKPYEECRFRKVFGRWHGRGIGEILATLQSYLNEVINLRLNKARISQIGLFKVRKGSGITQQLLSSLVSGGVVPVTRMDDIQELATSDVKGSSYNDEENAYRWGQRTTGAWDVGRGESLPSSMPATTAVIQERGMRSGMDLVQENLGMFLSRLFERHIIPLMLETIKDEEVISIVGSPEELKEIDKNYVNNVINKQILNHLIKNKEFPKPDFIEHLRGLYEENLKKFQKTRYFKVKKKMLEGWQYEVQVFVTGESFNKAVMVQQLNEMLLGYSKLPGANLDIDAIMKEILDLMGLGGSRFIKSRNEASVNSPMLDIPKPTQQRQFQETEMVGEAATAERVGAGLTPTM